jgi:hypothetical protein
MRLRYACARTVSGARADGERGRKREGSGVEPPIAGSHVGRERRFANRFGRCVAKPANALLLVVCVTASGMPDCSVSTPGID